MSSGETVAVFVCDKSFYATNFGDMNCDDIESTLFVNISAVFTVCVCRACLYVYTAIGHLTTG